MNKNLQWYELDRTREGQIVFVEMDEEEPPVEVLMDDFGNIEWVGSSDVWGFDETLGLYIFLADGETFALRVE